MTDKRKPHFGDQIVINSKAPFFNGEKAVVAYVGTEGVSVYLKESDFDECICIHNDEFDFA